MTLFLVIIGRIPMLKFLVCGTCGSDNLVNEITSEMSIIVKFLKNLLWIAFQSLYLTVWL